MGPAERDKLVRVLGLLGSPETGERAAAAWKAHQLVRGAGVSWADMLQSGRDSGTVEQLRRALCLERAERMAAENRVQGYKARMDRLRQAHEMLATGRGQPRPAGNSRFEPLQSGQLQKALDAAQAQRNTAETRARELAAEVDHLRRVKQELLAANARVWEEAHKHHRQTGTDTLSHADVRKTYLRTAERERARWRMVTVVLGVVLAGCIGGALLLSDSWRTMPHAEDSAAASDVVRDVGLRSALPNHHS